VKNSLLARSGNTGARRTKEIELIQMLLEAPEIAARQGEILAALPFGDRSLDRLRREVLDLAASGFRLEKRGLENHLIRAGLGELLERLGVPHAQGGLGGETADVPAGAGQGDAQVDDIETRWLRAAEQLREMAEIAPERLRAMERFKADGSEESWLEAHRLLARGLPND
jgi:DNA primase